MKTFDWYDEPTQVMFYDEDAPEDHCYRAGIAYRDKVICACCGGIFDIDELKEAAAADGKCAIVPFDTWVDFSDAIGISEEEVYEEIHNCGLDN